MRAIGRVIGFLTFLLAGLLLFFFYWSALISWLGGFLGSIVAFIVAPGIVIFPLVYWFIEGIFPVFYFILLGVGFGAALLFGLCEGGED
jgi:hypothetical protein